MTQSLLAFVFFQLSFLFPPQIQFASAPSRSNLKETNKDDQFDQIKSLRPSPNHQRRASSRDEYVLLERERFENPQDERPIHVPFHSRSSQGHFHSPGGRICKDHFVPSKFHCHSEITSLNGMPFEPADGRILTR